MNPVGRGEPLRVSVLRLMTWAASLCDGSEDNLSFLSMVKESSMSDGMLVRHRESCAVVGSDALCGPRDSTSREVRCVHLEDIVSHDAPPHCPESLKHRRERVLRRLLEDLVIFWSLVRVSSSIAKLSLPM